MLFAPVTLFSCVSVLPPQVFPCATCTTGRRAWCARRARCPSSTGTSSWRCAPAREAWPPSGSGGHPPSGTKSQQVRTAGKVWWEEGKEEREGDEARQRRTKVITFLALVFGIAPATCVSLSCRYCGCSCRRGYSAAAGQRACAADPLQVPRVRLLQNTLRRKSLVLPWLFEHGRLVI